MSRLLLVRHGDTGLNRGERYWGHTDIGLSAIGLRQAELLRHRLAKEKIDAVYSSDLMRALQTARTIAADNSKEVMVCPELREINFGYLEGLDYTEVSQFYPEVARLWAEGSPELSYPGGESLADFQRRVLGFLVRLEKQPAGATVLVVAHSASLRVLMCRLLGLDLGHWWQFRLDLGSLSVIGVYPAGGILDRLNDVCHLETG